MSEGLGVNLDPGYRLGEVLAPYATDLVKRQYSPERIARRLGRAGIDTLSLASELPGELHRIVEAIDRHGFEFDVRAESLLPVVRETTRQTDRLSLSILAGAALIGLAVVGSSSGPEAPWAGLVLRVGGALTAVLVAGLLWAALRPGKRG